MSLTRMKSFMRNESHYGFEFVPAPAMVGAGTLLNFSSNHAWKIKMSSTLSIQPDDLIASRRANAQVWFSGLRELIAEVSKRGRKFTDEGDRRLAESRDADEIDSFIESAERLERILGAAIVELSPLRSACPLTRQPKSLPTQLHLIAQE